MATQKLGRLSGKRVRINIDADAKPEEINVALKRIYGISGCDGCGRNGYDIIIGHGDPVFEGFSVPRVQGVVIEDVTVRG
jgi:hypothetical protein